MSNQDRYAEIQCLLKVGCDQVNEWISIAEFLLAEVKVKNTEIRCLRTAAQNLMQVVSETKRWDEE